MTFEELDGWLERWAQRQRRGIRETLARELLAIDTPAAHLQKADEAEFPNPW